jgi:selenocysteine lyase/cysteine desulfurase
MTLEDKLTEATENLSLESGTEVPFGRKFREKYFAFGDGVVIFNHGSFGATPRPVLEARTEYLRKANEFQDQYFRRDIFFSYSKETPLDRSRKVTAEVVDADVDNVVFVSNATTGVNTVLRSFPFERGDVIVYAQTIYPSCGNTLRWLEKYVGITVAAVELQYPMSQDEVVQTYTDAIDAQQKAGKTVRLCFFDTVSSVPACLMPWERLVEECRKRDVLSLVDGAHGIGLIDISLRKTKPDFFTSNLHKWFFVPTSCALLYVDPKHHHKIMSLPVSSPYPNAYDNVDNGKSDSKYLANLFSYTGTTDCTPFLCAPDALKFRNEVCGGEQKIRTYCHGLAKKAGPLISEMWGGTEILSGKGDEIITTMVNVALPLDLPVERHKRALQLLFAYLLDHKTAVNAFSYKGQLWTRWSFNVYNDIEEVPAVARIILGAVEHIKSSL